MTPLEANIEKSLIEQLIHGKSQWNYREDINNNEKLWANFREKLNQNNLSKLDGYPITDSEFVQIQQFMRDNSKTTYQAALWLAGEHGVAQIPLIRDDASLGKIMLMAVNSRDIAGGTSSYEVINQFVPSNGTTPRRFDVSLLINGIPMIHIELKNQDHPFYEAFNQIKKYGEEGQFNNLFGFVQMFVISNKVDTKYIAADRYGNISEKFLTRWVDENNNPVGDIIDFAKAVLNIPMAHEMVGKYAVLDNIKKRQILLRPYQVHAIENVRKAAKESQSGFVWHTTGSGKTLTSYTVTKNLLDIPSVDKTLFLIDRKDLDTQTSQNFKAYAENDDIDVENTENTWSLEKKLTDRSRTAIVTTIQKLQNIIRKCSVEKPSVAVQKLKKALQDKRLAFVIDECHRTVAPQTKRAIENFFPIPSLWYGFTGTPIFAENKRAAMGNLAQTTEELYGPCLHQYTIKEAIGDGSVLGFQIHTLGRSIEELRKIAIDNNLFTKAKIEKMTDPQLEKAVIDKCEASGIDLYGTEQHRRRVVEYICGPSSIGKLRLNLPKGEAFCAILTCSSIKEAQAYYREFKAYKESGKVSEEIKKLLPDFPKVAITYTIGENGENDQVNKKAMAESLADYKKMFPNANAEIEFIGAYNEDLNKRMARAESQYHVRENQLDLVIVVDRLLTGFDSPPLSTIFLDRPPMKPQHLIQAFSRTNRLFTEQKEFGQVVTMQFPSTYDYEINEALKLYSRGSLKDVSAPAYEKVLEKLKIAVARLLKIAPTPESVLKLPRDIKILAELISSFQQVDHLFSSIATYDQYDPKEIKMLVGMDVHDLDKYVGHYQNKRKELIDLIKNSTVDGGEPPIPIKVDLDKELETVKFIEVNYMYLVRLLQAHVPEDLAVDLTVITEKEVLAIQQYIDRYKKNSPEIGRIVEEIWNRLKENPQEFIGQDISNLIHERINIEKHQKIVDFCTKWHVSEPALLATLEAWNGKSEIISLKGDYEAYKASGGTESKLRYNKRVREAVNEFFAGTIKPFTEF